MKKYQTSIYLSLLLIGMSTYLSCQKYLEKKPNAKMALPGSIQDLQALMDADGDLNLRGNAVAEVSADNYYLTDQTYGSTPTPHQRLYTWQKDQTFHKDLPNSWGDIYIRVFNANVVLDNMPKIPVSNQEDWNDLKAQALFARALAFYEAVTTWSLAYDAATAQTDLGIPLRLTSDINEKIVRASVEECYQKIIRDLKEAIPLAKVKPLHVFRGSRTAIHALLSRTYMAMRDYENCFQQADLCLKLKNDLLDFNGNPPLNPTLPYPFNHSSLIYNNPEIIFGLQMSDHPNLNNPLVSSSFVATYDDNDLRKKVYFEANGDHTYNFKGSLAGYTRLFSGITVGEVYLMRAEAYARKSMTTEALQDLNTLLIKRWNKNVTYVPITAGGPDEALQYILAERRKELLMRGLRWMDLKRLNKEGANITLSRVVQGQTYTLPPNDKRYALEIPQYVIELNGIPQNVR